MNRNIIMAALSYSFNETNFSYHQKQDGVDY